MNAEPTTEPRTPSEIFRLLSEDFRRRVVKRALKHRSESKVLRRQRGAALRRLRVDGYRDASRAPRPKLLQPVLEAIEHHDQDLARAVLNAWVDSHAALRDRTAEHLASRGMPVPEPPDARFDSFWTREQWRGEREALAAVDGTVDPDSAGLMLCLLARRFPAPPPLASPLFEGWHEHAARSHGQQRWDRTRRTGANCSSAPRHPASLVRSDDHDGQAPRLAAVVVPLRPTSPGRPALAR